MQKAGDMSASYLHYEYEAMKEGGLSNEAWYAMPRPDRAARVAHMLLLRTIKACADYDAIEASKRKS